MTMTCLILKKTPHGLCSCLWQLNILSLWQIEEIILTKKLNARWKVGGWGVGMRAWYMFWQLKRTTGAWKQLRWLIKPRTRWHSPARLPARWACEKWNVPEQGIKIQDCSHKLQFVTTAAAFLSQTKRFLQSPASPWASSTWELPRAPCTGGMSLSAQTHFTCALADALPAPSPGTSPVCGGRTVHTQRAPCQPGTPWHEQNNPALPSPTAGNVHQISSFFCSINGRKGAEPRLEMVVLWLCVCHTFPYFKFSPMTNSLFKSFKQK